MNPSNPPSDEALPTPSSPAPDETAPASPARQKRMWALALGSAAIWHLDPALAEMAELIGCVACSASKAMAKDALSELRLKAAALRKEVGPMPASALAKVVRRTEAASGAVLDKGARVQEVQTSWDHFLACVRAWQGPAQR